MWTATLKIDMEIFKEDHKYDICCHVKNVTQWLHVFHWHDNFEICEIINKTASFLIDGQTVVAEPGDLVFFNRRCVHLFMIEDKDVFIRIMQFPLKTLLAYDSNIQLITPHIKRGEISKITGLEKLVDVCLNEITNESPLEIGGKNPYLSGLVCTLYFALAKYFPNVKSSPHSTASKLFFDMVEYLNEHYTNEDITVESIAKRMYVSREKISAEFIKYAGMSLKNYLYSLRINAVNLLINDGCDIGSAALKCGFNNLRTFNYAYKRITGITPTEYLNQQKRRLQD